MMDGGRKRSRGAAKRGKDTREGGAIVLAQVPDCERAGGLDFERRWEQRSRRRRIVVTE